MRLWVADLTYYLARALRTVGVGLMATAWASALASEAQQYTEQRAYLIVAAAVLGVLASQWFAGLPPSARPIEIVRGFERDIVTVARELARGDRDLQRSLTAGIAALAVERLRAGANVPADRRAWLRLLAQLASERGAAVQSRQL